MNNPTTSTIGTKQAAPRLNYAKAAPRVMEAMLALQAAADETGLDETLLNLVKLRASQINGCAFCIDMHVREAKAIGETDERLHLLAAWREVDVYTAREEAALAWTELLTRLAGTHVSEGDYAAARAVFSEKELAELSLVIVAINGWNRLNVGFRMPPGFGE